MEAPISAKSAVLQVLLSGPAFGLEIIERVRDRTQGEIRLHQGSVYPALRSLEGDGLLRSYDGETVPARGGRPRRYYELTAEGARAARSQREAMAGLLQPTWERA